MLVFGLFFGAVVGKLVDLQVLNATKYDQEGMRQRFVSVQLPAGRGSLIDRNGEDLALSIPQTTLYADPSEITDPVTTAQRLAPVLQLDERGLEDKFRMKGRFVYVARQVDDQVAATVKKMKLVGIHSLDEYKRFNPAGLMARSLVGAVDLDGNGTAGLEKQYDKDLAGRAGKLTFERNPQGGTIATGTQSLEPARPGRDLMLTIDRSMQFKTEQVLGDQVKATGAKGGIAIVARPSTGEILAMANMTTLPDTGEVVPSSANMAATTTFEPGSVNKVIMVSAAVEEHLVQPDTSLMVPDQLQVADALFKDDEPHATQGMTVTQILAQSSNIGAIMLGYKLGRNRIDGYMHKFGLGAVTALKYPNEPAGLLLAPAKWSGTSIGSIPIGQGISVTAIQMLSAFNTIANDGVYVAPKLVAATVDQDGTRRPTAASASHRVVRVDTARAVQQMMVQVVKNGTGKAAAVPGYTVAGKTGTARKPLPQGGYKDANGAYHYVSTFAGFIPGAGSDLSIIVVMDEPTSSIYAADVAAPVFAKLATYALRQFHIPPQDGADSSAAAGAIVVQNQTPATTPADTSSGTSGTTGTGTTGTTGTTPVGGRASGTSGTSGRSGTSGSTTTTTVPTRNHTGYGPPTTGYRTGTG